MIRTPLRPLARILQARRLGENPDAIERENLRLRHEGLRDRARLRAEGRLMVLGVFFFAAFIVVGGRMGMLATSEPSEPRVASVASSILAQRADIVDRRGRVLATNLATYSLYAQPQMMVDPNFVAGELAKIFPDLNAETLARDLTGSRKFLWIRKKLSPEQLQAVHDIGDPGLLFGPREMRLYPNGTLAAHILGGASFGREGVHSAEVIGVAGVEKTFDTFLRDPANDGKPLELSLDLSVQAAVEEVLGGGMKLLGAKAATAVMLNVRTGEIVAMASLPDFDPNTRPAAPTKGEPGDSPLFNRAVQGVYELGSTFKVFAIAQALELKLVAPETMVDTKNPLVWGKYKIRDFHDYGAQLSVTDVIVKSSNIGTAHIAQMIGGVRQKEFLRRFGLLDPVEVELVEAPTGKPLFPRDWSEISTMTISYGHGVAASPLHLAAAYATIANSGIKVTPTILKTDKPAAGPRVLSAETATQMLQLLRAVVTRGTASFAEVPGYAVGGKTGTADKPDARGGYAKDKVIATFAGVFPAHDPAYVIVVTLDEPVEDSGTEDRRTAGWTAVPVAAEIIRRTAPLLGLRPMVEPGAPVGVTLVRN